MPSPHPAIVGVAHLSRYDCWQCVANSEVWALEIFLLLDDLEKLKVLSVRTRHALPIFQ